MAIELTALQQLLKKAGQQPTDPGSQAMALAAQAAKPPGGMPLPKAVDQQQDPAGEAVSAEQQAMEQEKLEAQRKSEVDKRDKEIQTLQGELQMEQVARERASAQADISQQQQKAQQQLQGEREKLEQQKTLAQAGEIQHRAQLEKETAKQQVTIAQDKAKSLMDIANQQAQRYVKTTDDARKQSDKYYEGMRTKLDAQREAARPGISPALQTQMTGAVAAMKNIGSLRKRMHAIPRPGTPPTLVKAASAPQAPAPSAQAPQAPKQPTPPQTPTPPQAPPPQTPAPQQGTTVPQPGAAPSSSQQSMLDTVRNNSSQQYGAQLRSEYMPNGGSLAQTAVGTAKMENAIAEAEGSGDTERANALRQQLNNAQSQFQTRQQQLQQQASSGDITAKKQLAEYGDISAQRGQWSLTDWKSDASELDNIRNSYKTQQDEKNAWNNKSWSDPRRWADAAIRYSPGALALKAVDSMIVNPIVESSRNWNQSHDMAARRGVNRTYFGADEGNQHMIDDYKASAESRGLHTNAWADLGSTAGNTALAASTVIPGVGVIGAAGRAGAIGARALGAGARAMRAGGTLAQGASRAKNVYGAGRALNQANRLRASGMTAEQMAARTGGDWATRAARGLKTPSGVLGTGAFVGDTASSIFGSGPSQQLNAADATGYSGDNPYYQNSAGMGQNLQYRGDFNKVAAATQPVQPPVVRGGQRTAQQWNNGYNHTGMATSEMGDPYAHGMGKAMKFFSPWVQSLTGGAIQLVKDRKVPYNSRARINPDMMANSLMSTSTDSRFSSNDALTPAHSMLSAQYTAAHQSYPQQDFNAPQQVSDAIAKA